MLDRIPLQRPGLGSGLPDRLEERGSLEGKGYGQHHIPDEEAFGWLRTDEFAIIRKTSLPESAHECAASATSDADPVSTAAAVFATAIRTLAPKATSTVVTLSDVLGPRSNCSRAISHS